MNGSINIAGYDLTSLEIAQHAKSEKCESISYTYNEPTIFLEYALDTMKLAKQNGLKNVWVSNGFMSNKTLNLIMPYLDAINIDIKSFDEAFYKSQCGAKLEPILENCKRIVRENIWLEITTLIIPTFSDNLKMLRFLAEFIKNELGDFIPWHISAFSGKISWKMKNVPDTSIETIKSVYETAKSAGLKYVYAGNVIDANLENTYCPKCDNIFIKRSSYNVKRMDKSGN